MKILLSFLIYFLLGERSYSEPVSLYTLEINKLKSSIEELQVEKSRLADFHRAFLVENPPKIIPNIPMPEKDQVYLFNKTLEHKLNYKKTLAILKHESQFDHKAISHTKDYGYMQINHIHHENMSEKLNTKLDPLDPQINIDWGTYILGSLYDKYKSKAYLGTKLDRAVWSAYNRGEYGYEKKGEVPRYINRTLKELRWIQEEMRKIDEN